MRERTVDFADRVAARAAEVRLARALLLVVVAPLYLVGFVVGLLFLVVVWCFAAAQMGWRDARARGGGS